MTEQQILSPLSTSGISKYASFMYHRCMETAVWTFAELGIADLLAAKSKPQTASELASDQGWNSECLYRLLNAVSNAGIVYEIQSNEIENMEPEKTNYFELTEDRSMLTSNHPSKARYLLRWELSPLMKTASNYLPQIVREGYSKGNGMDQIIGNRTIFEYLKDEQNRDLSHCFDEAMTYLSISSAQAVVDAFDFSQFTTLVDIGGSLGVLLSIMLAHYPTIKQGICFDLPHVVQQPIVDREFEQQKISKDRYQFVAGDMFDAKTIPQVDAYILKNIVHDWNDERCIDFLKAIRIAANGKRITLLIIEHIILPQIPDNKQINWCAHAVDLLMMTAVNAKERTEGQHRYLLQQSRFVLKHVHLTASPISIIEATTND